MKLYVMRHGPAEDNAASGRDVDRALTVSGRERVRDVARVLAREKELPARILASWLVRAQQTAEIVATAAKAEGWKGLIETARELEPGGRQYELVHALDTARAEAPMIVGHEPDLSTLVERLLGDPLPVPMDKAMVVALTIISGMPVKLRFIIEPRTLAITHDSRG